MNLLIAPPGGGKTTHLVGLARTAAGQGRRVWWVGLPSQRSYVYRRLTEAGALLGAEFLSSQQVYYRLLAHALKLRPLLLGTGRLALVGEALAQLRGELPSPGEARLFAQAIAEAKRFGLGYRDVLGQDDETRRFRDVFRVYEVIKGERWDYDDFRTEALKHSLALIQQPEADLILVDGFREVGPLEFRIYAALSVHVETWLSLPRLPPLSTEMLLGVQGKAVVSPVQNLTSSSSKDDTAQIFPVTTCNPAPVPAPDAPRVYRATNPVAEARWVLRSLKRDLAGGMKALELAVILPAGQVRAFAALADEYGVPVMDETPKALADTLAGRILNDLLALPDYPTPSRLLAIPDLQPLASAALGRGVAGLEAIGVLAETLGQGTVWRKWLGLLEVPENELAWAETLLSSSLPELRRELLSDESLGFAQFKQHALQRAKEASALAKGASFRAWWAALLQETQVFERPRGGVALLTDKLASGRRFARAYLMRATEGAYTVGEREDYFIPEDARSSLEQVFGRLGLPRRFLGRDAALYQELLTRADELIVSYPEADQGGPLIPEPELVLRPAGGVPRLPELPAASRLELPSDQRYQAEAAPVTLGQADLETLRRYSECAFRVWAESRLERPERPWWAQLVSELRAHRRLNAARLDVLKADYPEAAPWLAQHAETLLELQFGVSLPEDGAGPRARLDAVTRSGTEVSCYRFTGPQRLSEREASSYLEARWTELWTAGHLLGRYPGRVSRVHLLVWPVGGLPIAAYDGGVAQVWRRIASVQHQADSAHERYLSGDVRPSPGFRCRTCAVADLCRAGQR